MGADSVLVNAAHKLGMSRVPGDTAEIFNKQYEGLIAYHKAEAGTIVEGVKAGIVGGSVVGGLIADGVNAIIAGSQKRGAKKDFAKSKQTQADTDALNARTAEIEAAQAGKKLKNKSRHKKLADAVYAEDSKTEDGEETKAETRAGELELYAEKLKIKNQYKNFNQYEDDEAEYKKDLEKGPGLADEYQGIDQDNAPLAMKSSFKKTSPVKNVKEQSTSVNTGNLRKSSGPKKSTILSEDESTSQSPSASEMNKTIEKMVTDLAIDGIKSAGKHYDDGGVQVRQTHHLIYSYPFKS